MTVYDNRNDRSKITSVDVDEKTGLAFLSLRHVGDRDDIKKLLADIGQELVAETRINTLPVFVTRGISKKEELFTKLKTNPQDNFEIHVPEKKGLLGFLKKNGWKLRGGLSIAGQGLTLFSAFRGVNEDGSSKPFEAPTGIFAVFNLLANLTNIVFGGQKEKDEYGLRHLSEEIAKEVNRYPEHTGYKFSADDVYKVAYMDAKEKADLDKEKTVWGKLKRNSVWFGEVGLRTIGSVSMMLSPGDWKFSNWGNAAKALFKEGPKSAWDTIRTKDRFTFWAGTGMVTGKILGLAAQTYDENNPPKGVIAVFRQKVFWLAASVVEFFAQGSLIYDRAVNKKINIGGKKTDTGYIGGKTIQDIPASIGNTALTAPYPVRMILDYGRKELDIKEVHARLLDAFKKIPEGEISTVAARITARTVEHLGEKSPDFSVLYGQIVDKLEKYHEIPLTAKPEFSYNVVKPAVNVTPAQTTETLPKEAANSPVYDVNAKPEIAAKDGEVTKSFAEKFQQPEKKSPEDHKTKREHHHHENITDMIDTSRQNLGGATVGA